MPYTTPKLVYRIANKRYFNNCLPDIPVHFGHLKQAALGCYWYPRVGVYDYGCIVLNENTKRWSAVWIGSLLHEMVHVQYRKRKIDPHGYIFQRRLKQLVQKGAYHGLL
jgi:hypothetical protein